MGKRRLYKKPAVRFVKLQADEAIADQCWSPSHDQTHNAYYNDPGFGGIYFTMGSNKNNCGAQLIIHYYYNNAGQQIGADEYLRHHPEYGTVSNMNTQLLSEIGGQLGGNNGTNYQGRGSVTPNPPSRWSL